MDKIGCVAVVKNEEPHIAEWLAWQYVAGFDSVILLDNGSTDRTAQVASAFASKHDVRVFGWNGTTDYQTGGYALAVAKLGDEFSWLAFFDADEFLVLDEGFGLKACLEQTDAAAVGVPWAIFGSAGHVGPPDGLIIESYQRRAGDDFGPNRHIKSIIRPALMTKVLNAHAFEMQGDYADLAGRPLDFVSPGILAGQPVFSPGRLNHYFTKSRADWERKLRRGYPDMTRAGSEFALYDRNEVPDGRAASLAPAVRALIANIANPAPPLYRFVLAACARWETRYITEWLLYHRLIGFEHVFLYCNDDAPAALYREVLPFVTGPAPFVTFVHFPEVGAQHAMYLDFLRNHKDKTEWFCLLDIDEFIRLPKHNSIGAFVAGYEGADSIYFNWCIFGNSGFAERPAGDVLTTYTRRSTGRDSFMTKHITRAAAVNPAAIRLGPMSDFWHYLNCLENFEALKIVNVLGHDMHRYYDSPEASRAVFEAPGVFEAMLTHGIVNHYRFKSKADFLLRAERGAHGVFARQADHRRQYEDGTADAVLAHLDAVDDEVLANLWRRVCAQESPGTEPPAAATATARWAFHPIEGGFQADLGEITTIRQLRFAARPAFTERRIVVAVSIDGTGWAEIFAGAADSQYIWDGPGAAWARHIRVLFQDGTGSVTEITGSLS